MDRIDTGEQTMTRMQRHAAEKQRKRARRQSAQKGLFALAKIGSVLMISFACVVYLVNMPESSSYFTSQGQSEALSVNLSSQQSATSEEQTAQGSPEPLSGEIHLEGDAAAEPEHPEEAGEEPEEFEEPIKPEESEESEESGQTAEEMDGVDGAEE